MRLHCTTFFKRGFDEKCLDHITAYKFTHLWDTINDEAMVSQQVTGIQQKQTLKLAHTVCMYMYMHTVPSVTAWSSNGK